LKACRSLIASARCAAGASVELADLRPCKWLQMTCLALRSGLLCSSLFLAAASALGSAYGFLQGAWLLGVVEAMCHWSRSIART
jgi:hypothetical protein